MESFKNLEKICQNALSDSSLKDNALIELITQSICQALNKEKEENLKKNLLKFCHNLNNQGFFSGTSGNLSIRASSNPNEILITPSGVNKGELILDDIIKMNLEGDKIQGHRKPTSEIKMHLWIYQKREDIGAIVHAHPPFATGFAAAGLSLDQEVLPEAILVLGKVPLVEYATPSTWELPQNLDQYLKEHNSFLLANHGALTLGENIEQASHRMETLELFAKVILIARILGGEKLLTKEQLDKLSKIHP